MKNIILSAVITIVLAGCTPMEFGPKENKLGVAITEESIFWGDIKSIENRLSKEIFNIDVISVTDKRGPSNFANDIKDNVIHEYRPAKLTIGLLPYLKGMLHKTLQFNKQQEVTYYAEYTLKDISTKIITGDFWSGKFGIYEAKVSMDVIIRDKTSKVILQKSFNTKATKNRKVAKGRNPDVANDRQNMLDTLNTALKKIAILSAWEVRQTLNGTRDYYDPLKKSTIDEVYE